jgi:cytochrome c biogenesis protein CcmG/thiol:disulfide interchange protein DsbE
MRSWRRPRTLALGGTVALAAGVLAAGLLVGSPGGDGSGLAEATPRENRKAAPELEGEWLVGPPVRLAELRGTPVLINVWASWCVPCREEAPDLARFDRELRGRARLVGIDFQDAKADALAFIREFGWRFPNVADPQGRLAADYGLVGLPTTFVVDGEGRIARALTGAQTYDALVRAVEEVER